MRRLAPSELPSRPQLPEVLEFLDGRRVTTQSDWAERREELKSLILTYEYGSMPPARPVELDATLSEGPAEGAEGFTRALELRFGGQLWAKVDLSLPAYAPWPAPVILRIGPGCPDLETTLDRGYAFCALHNQDLEPDKSGEQYEGPAQQAFPGYEWGCLAAWAWGASRVLDWLESVPEIDASKAVITGHSRTGKAALLAGALDERFAVVAPNGSGCGGAALYRVYGEGCETLEAITRPDRFKAWFKEDFGEFAGQEDRLPFDQHFLRALVAPRPVLATEALDDAWANLLGTQAAWEAAQPVFDWLGAPQANAVHFREGAHAQLAEDFACLLDFADWHLKGAPWPQRLNNAPCYPETR